MAEGRTRKTRTRRSKPVAETRPFPSREEVAAFIRESPQPVGKREIARAFQIRGSDRIALKALMKELAEEGLLERRERRKLARPGSLPAVAVVEVSEIDEDGELLARPAAWGEDGPAPVIYLAPGKRSRAALAPGDRVLARLKRIEPGRYEGEPIRRIAAQPRRVLGIYERSAAGGRLRPTDRRARSGFIVRTGDAAGAEPGELVLAEVRPGPPRLGQREARIVERLGGVGDPRALSLIAIHEHELPVEFSSADLAEAAAARAAPLGKRVDLRAVPLVTIDGADARDFDDAVWAEPDPDRANRGGWHILVAIADVAHYVTEGSALDHTAYERGNSVYFPDRVVPMLPEALSNGWCSLKPGEDRPCVVAELWLNADGKALRHRFLRGLMRSAARLTYEQVQAAHDGRAGSGPAEPLRAPVLAPLYGAFGALLRARERRGTLDIEMPERRVVLAEDGTVAAIEPRERVDSHRLIEEFMIAANVAAARQLEALRQPCMYRVHDQPDPVKIEALRQILETLGLRLARGQAIRPRVLTDILHKVAGRPEARMVNELVLRAQSQAVYSPQNIGHFGLALAQYAHFTSPIRRYADLLVHRALIKGLRLGADGLSPEVDARFASIGEHISTTERRAAAAERDAVDRFTAAFLQDRIGAVFAGAVNGVTRFGLFVTLDETGADGLVPISLLPADYYDHVEAEHCLTGRRHGRVYRLGQRVQARLREADPTTGGIVLELVEGSDAARPAVPRSRPGRARRAPRWHPLDPKDPERPPRRARATARAKPKGGKSGTAKPKGRKRGR